MHKRALLLLNPHASQGQADLREALARLERSGFELVHEALAKDVNASDTMRRHAGKVDLVIVGGGDGSLNAAIEGLLELQVPLGVLPLGTANDFARTLSIPFDIAEACDVIVQGNVARIDLGWVNGKHFFNVASLGLSVQIARQLTGEAKSRWGVLAYLLTALRVLFRSRSFPAVIRGGGETFHVRTLQIAVGNGRHYGGSMTIHADARLDDGILHLCSIEIERWWRLVPLLPAMRFGRLTGTKRLRTMQGTEFEIDISAHERAIDADGELVGRSPCRFRVIPSALAVIVPGPAATELT